MGDTAHSAKVNWFGSELVKECPHSARSSPVHEAQGVAAREFDSATVVERLLLRAHPTREVARRR
jgi:hypothetical protein